MKYKKQYFHCGDYLRGALAQEIREIESAVGNINVPWCNWYLKWVGNLVCHTMTIQKSMVENFIYNISIINNISLGLYPDTVEVVGSNPIVPTRKIKGLWLRL